MEIMRVCALYYSAAGSTARTVRAIGEPLAKALEASWEENAFTVPAERARDYIFGPEDLVVVGSPTYAGRLPNKIAPSLREHLHGNGALAVAAVTFGNRAYDNSLAELCALLTDKGFLVIAAGAFVSQHAFTDQLAYGRPNSMDLAEMRTFSGRIAGKIREGVLRPATAPGDPEAPYYVPKGTDGLPAKFLKAKPQTDLSRCTGCGACARLCPMGAIDSKDPASVPGTCIKCQRCVRRCTKGAKFFDDPAFLSHVAMLEQNFQEPKENEVFL